MKSSSIVGLIITAMFLGMFYLSGFQAGGWAVCGLFAAVFTLMNAL